jgi:TPR repeat protein
MRRGEHDVAIARVLGMCQNGAAQACFIGAKYLDRLHLDARLGTSAKELKARGVAIFEEKCGADDQAMCVEYARLLLAGKYVAPDVKRGRALVEKACEAKQPRACLTLGRMYASGQGVKKNKKRAIALLEQACAASGGAACTALAEQLPASPRKRIDELLARACGDDDADACAREGAFIDRAAKDEVQRAVAAELLLKACELDELKSCVRGGELGKIKDPVRARAAFERGCDGEIFAACVGLAPMIATGTGGPRDFGEGVALADKQCKQKVPKACDVAAHLRRSPPDVSCTTVDACRPLCDEKIPNACASLAEIQIKANVATGCDDGIDALIDACDAGHAGSCAIVGNETSDVRAAVARYAAACTGKVASACLLRDAAAAEAGTKAERARAVAALKRACTSKHPAACAWYGRALSTVKRGSGDKLLQQACDAGVGSACRWLASMLDTNPHYGIGDGSYQPFDEQLEKRVRALRERGCKLGDHDACVRAAYDRAEDVDTLPPRPCGTEPRWAL